MATITLDQLPGEIRRTALLLDDGGVKAMRRTARAGQRIIQGTIDETEPHKPVDTGQFRRSFFVADVPDGADLDNPVLYAPVIEYGSDPHWVPLEPLLAWARRKSRGMQFDSHTNLKTRRTVKARGQVLKDFREEAAMALAVGTQRKIARYGTEGRHVVERSQPEIIRMAGRIIDDMLREMARR